MTTLSALRCCIVSSSSYSSSSSSSSSSTTTTSSSVKNKNTHRFVGRHQRAQRTTTRLRAKRDDEEKNDENNKLPEFEDDVAPALDGDWREFRAKLVASQATAELPDEQIDVEQLQQQMQGAKTNNQEKEKRKTTKSGYGIIDDAIDNVKIESPEERERREREATEANLELLKTQNPELAKDKAWAHVIAKPEKGSLIVAATDDFVTSQQYFNQCVILLLEHSKDGSMGVILNRPTMYKMADVVNDENGPFSENALYFGGDVGDGTVSFLHGSPDVADAEEVSPGVYIGGFNDAGRLVKEGKKDPREFKFFARYCGWAPGQLEDECDRGVWYPVACSRQIALKPVIALPKPLWREVLELCGGELALKAKRAYAAEDEN